MSSKLLRSDLHQQQEMALIDLIISGFPALRKAIISDTGENKIVSL